MEAQIRKENATGRNKITCVGECGGGGFCVWNWPNNKLRPRNGCVGREGRDFVAVSMRYILLGLYIVLILASENVR